MSGGINNDKPGFLPNFLNDRGVNVIISGGMGGGARGDAKTAAEQYLQGKLESTGSICHEHQHHDECGE